MVRTACKARGGLVACVGEGWLEGCGSGGGGWGGGTTPSPASTRGKSQRLQQVPPGRKTPVAPPASPGASHLPSHQPALMTEPRGLVTEPAARPAAHQLHAHLAPCCPTQVSVRGASALRRAQKKRGASGWLAGWLVGWLMLLPLPPNGPGLSLSFQGRRRVDSCAPSRALGLQPAPLFGLRERLLFQLNLL